MNALPDWHGGPGKALVLRTCEEDGHGTLTGWGGFIWPRNGTVEAPDWDPAPHCGGGLHGLLWGQGFLSYLGRLNGKIFMVVEVDEADVVWVHDDKVKFPRGTVIHVGPYAEAMELIHRYAPRNLEQTRTLADISRWPHDLYSVDLDQNDDVESVPYADEHDEERIKVDTPGPLARIFSSKIRDGAPGLDPWETHGEPMHTVAIDVDHHVRVVPSSTPGHYHLFIDVPMPWSKYRRLLKALSKAGIIEEGYYRVSVARKQTFLRLPWIRKKKVT